jgi:hypothetical protein
MKNALFLCFLFASSILMGQNVFRHLTTEKNTAGHITTLDHPQLNGNAKAIVFILPNYNVNGAEAGGQNYNQNAGVWYDGGRWTIFNQNTKEPMPLNMTFNVMIAPENDPNYFTYTVKQTDIAANAAPNGAIIDHPMTNGKTKAMLLITQNWGGIYNDASQVVGYAKGQWRISNNGYLAFWNGQTTDVRCLMPVGAQFNVMVIENSKVSGFPSAQAFMHTTSAANTMFDFITFLEPKNLIENKETILFATAYWGHGEAESNGPSQGSGPYNEGPLVAWYDHPEDPWKYKDGYWSFYNSNAAKFQEGAKVNVVAIQGNTTCTSCNEQLFAPEITQRESAKIVVPDLFKEGPEELDVQIVGDYIVFQGDIVLGLVSNYTKKSNGELILKNKKKGKGNRDALNPNANRLWPNGVIPYQIVSNHPLASTINNAIATINRTTNLCLRPRTTEIDFVQFMNYNDRSRAGCWSFVIGRNGGLQEVNIGNGCNSQGIVMNEILHAAGVLHEQCRPDRDDFVRIIASNIQPNMISNFNKVGRVFSTCPYDYNSIMHYGNFAFAINPLLPTIQPINPSTARIGQRSGLSECDIKGIRFLYPNAVGCAAQTNSESIVFFSETNFFR